MVIDFHTHAFEPAAAADPQAWAQTHREAYWGQLVTQGPQGWSNPAAMRAQMDAEGIDVAVLQGWYWEQLATCEAANEAVLAWAATAPARFVPFATTQPAAGRPAVRAVEAALDAGCRGIGELMPTAQGWSVRDATFGAICDLAADRQVPLCLHVTEPVGHTYPGRLDTPLADYLWLAEQHTRTRFVWAHWGGGLPFYLLNPYAAKAFANCYFDTAASPLLYRPEIWAMAARHFPVERLLFGSDFPLRLYPRQEKKPGWTRLMAEIAAHWPAEEDASALMGGNAARLLGRPEPEPPDAPS